MANLMPNDPCPCGSGKAHGKCCGRAALPVPDLPTVEGALQAVEKMFDDHDFDLPESREAPPDNEFLRLDVGVEREQTPLDKALAIMAKARESTDRSERVALAREALEISEECAEAYVILGDQDAESPEQAMELYAKGVEYGARFLGAEGFAETVGHFWSVVETRPYMRAKEGLADCLWVLGQGSEALDNYRELLRLNPDDDQGIRFKLLGCLMREGDIDHAASHLARYREDSSAMWLYTQALVRFIQAGDSQQSRESMIAALAHNRHVKPYLLRQRKLRHRTSDMMSPGERREAVYYVSEWRDYWTDVPGALDWLTSF